MRTAQDIILKPIITEESMMGIMTKKYTFKVAKDANKIEIAKAVEAVFPGTKVAKVNIMNVRGQKQFTEGYTGLLAAGKCFNLAFEIFFSETKTF